MKYIKPMTTIILANSLLLFNACTPNQMPVIEGGYYHSEIYFGKNFSTNYQQGISDGCTTAKGNYKKSHTLFKNDYDYNKGWFLGRNKCRHLLVIDEKKEGK